MSFRDDRLIEGIRLFNRGEFFACHEVLEEQWTPERGPNRLFLQAIIHIAVALYHAERNNRVGAIGQMQKGLTKLEAYLPCWCRVDTARLSRDAAAILKCIKSKTTFTPPRIRLV